MDSPKQELTFYDLLWLIVGGGFLLSLVWDSWLLLVGLVFSVYWCVRSLKEAQRTRYLRAYEFPAPVRERVRKRYPHLSEEQLSLVMLGLRQYFIFCNAAAGCRVSMPSQVVDAAWHEFILFTREYADFCNKGLNRFLHHVPASGVPTAGVSPAGADAGVKTAWGLPANGKGSTPRNRSGCHSCLKSTQDCSFRTDSGIPSPMTTRRMAIRQREGVVKAKAAGKYKGRKPIGDAIRQEVVRLAGERMTKTAIADQLNIGEATVYRILAAAPKKTAQHRLPQSEVGFGIEDSVTGFKKARAP